MNVALTVLNGVHKGRQIPLTMPTFLIGRGPHCHLRPVREDVGREHCAIVQRGNRVFLRDYGSTNGTILNQETLVQGEVPLKDGDVFEIGPLRFQVTVTAEPVAAKAAGEDDDDALTANEIYSGQPGEAEPKPDSTVLISRPSFKKALHRAPMPDEGEKLY